MLKTIFQFIELEKILGTYGISKLSPDFKLLAINKNIHISISQITDTTIWEIILTETFSKINITYYVKKDLKSYETDCEEFINIPTSNGKEMIFTQSEYGLKQINTKIELEEIKTKIISQLLDKDNLKIYLTEELNSLNPEETLISVSSNIT